VHPLNWRSGYKYVAFVIKNKLMSVYEVDETTEKAGSRISTLKLLSKAVIGTLPIKKRYIVQGAQRKKTFVFSHRYIDKLADLHTFFASKRFIVDAG